MPEFEYSGCSHLHMVLNPKTVRKMLITAVKCLKKIEFDTIVVSGVSGQLFGPMLAYYLKKPIAVIRKVKDKTDHNAERFEGNKGLYRYIVVDDLIDTGKTLRYIVRNVDIRVPGAVLVGAYLYNQDRWKSGKECYQYHGVPKRCVDVPPDAIGASPHASAAKVGA